MTESLSGRDQRVFSVVFNAITRALCPRRYVPLAERSEAAYMILAAINAELPPAANRRGLHLVDGRLTVRVEVGNLCAGVRVSSDAVSMLLPLLVIRWHR
ncbi:hypothetical protein [Salinispora vitiensis]|uniref:hypothetical protein n=1 Tax=Salinispora vitiensis TaxID=999544 RepID=UPI000376374C|nr:hypothetical protein [Salinispora vitiensis]